MAKLENIKSKLFEDDKKMPKYRNCRKKNNIIYKRVNPKKAWLEKEIHKYMLSSAFQSEKWEWVWQKSDRKTVAKKLVNILAKNEHFDYMRKYDLTWQSSKQTFWLAVAFPCK